MLYLISIFSAVVFAKGKIDFTDASAAFVGIFYVAVTFTCIVLLRGVGEYTYLLVFVGPWVSDTFAYFCGRLFGRHKLIPEISPKKTVEGSIGGIIFAALSYIVFAIIIKVFFLRSETSLHPQSKDTIISRITVLCSPATAVFWTGSTVLY